ncbi:MAG: leucine-rich repeat protein [Prevotella sp.]|nr:leucine-rich repeat protein [Prevotella sp.]
MKTETKTKNLFARAAMMLLVMLLTSATAGAQATEQEGDWQYTYDSGTNILTITSYEGTDASVTTPTMLGGHAVTAIGHACFRVNNPHTYMTSVTISEGITTIGTNAFEGCSNLASVNLPNCLVSINAYAFYNCSALTSITIPSSVTSIGMFPFTNSGLTDLYYTGTKAQWNNVTLDERDFINGPTVHWRCTATFDMLGHGTAPAAQTVYSAVANALTVPTAPTATGYDFGGWYDNAACTGSAFDFTAALDDNVTIYAKWTALENTITFDLGGRGTAISNQTVTSGNIVTEPAVQFDGADGIEGWYTDEGRTTPYDFTTAVDHSMTLYAKWAAAGTATITANAGGTVTLTNANRQVFADGKVMPGNYTLTVTPESGYSFSGTYTLTNRSNSTSDMPYNIIGSAVKTYALDLTEKNAAINVTFSSNPILTVTTRADDASVLSQVTWSVVNNQTPSTTYSNGSTIPYDTSGMVAENFGIRLNVDLGSLSGYAFTATITDMGNGTTTYKNSNEGTSFKIVPHGSIDIDLYVYQPQTIALLDDGSNIDDITALNGDVADVTLKRAFTNGKKQTLCLPFAPSAILSLGLGKMYEFTDVSDGKAVMTERTSGLKANTPYIFEPNQDIDAATGIAFENVTINYNADPKTVKSSKNFTFHGTYTQKTWEADEAVAANIYGFMMQENDGQQVGQFVKARRKTILRPFSCWLEYTGTGDLTDTNPTSQAAARRTTRGEGETLPDVIDIVWVSALGSTTGIHAADAVTTQHDDWYTLDGRRLSGKPSVKGVYINNGRKVVIK